MARQCSVCRESKGEEAFSSRQWSAQARSRKCRACTQAQENAPPCAAHIEAAGAREAGAPGSLPQLLAEADSRVPGMLVRVKGLQKAHEHNGKLATILTKQAPVQGRVCIAMKDGKELSVKQESIEPVCLNCLSAGVLAVCSKCKTAAFCSPACQATKWPKHMNECGDGRLAAADCQKMLKPSETVFFLGRCDGAAAFYLSALGRDAKTGGTVFAQLVIGIKRGIRGATYEKAPHFRTWKSAADIKAYLEHTMTAADFYGSSRDRGGTANGTYREVFRRICGALAAALARRAEAETIQLDRQILHADKDILKALDVFRRRGSAGSSEAAGDDALLADPLLGSREAAQLKELISSRLLGGYKCGVRLVQLLQEGNQRCLDWIGVIYNMLHCRGEYTYCYSFVDIGRMGRWHDSWLPVGTSDAQKVEATLLGMYQDRKHCVRDPRASQCVCCEGCPSASVAKVAPMMRHMSLWHALGGEDNLSALTLLAAEDAEACWYTSAIVVGLMLNAEPERFQRHVQFSFGQFRGRLHRDYLHHWCAVSVASCAELRGMADESRAEREQERQLQKQSAASVAKETSARTFVDKDTGRRLTLGSGYSEADVEDLQGQLAGMGVEMEHAAQSQSHQTAGPPQGLTAHLVCANDMEELCDEIGFPSVDVLMAFCQHVNNRRHREESSSNQDGRMLDLGSTVRGALPVWSALRSSDACADSLEALEAQARLKPPPAGVRRQLADVYLWELGLAEIEGAVSARERHRRRERGMALLHEAADVEEDCEAMGALADHHLIALGHEFNPQCESEVFNSGKLPSLTQAVKDNENFQACIRCLGRAAAKGWVSPTLLHLGYQTYADPTILHGIEGAAEITAVVTKRADYLMTSARANVLARGDSVRKIAAEEGLRGADRLRLVGNDMFKKKMYKASRKEYSKALDVVALVLEQRGGAGDLELNSREARVKCLANRAECNLKLENFPGALSDVLAARDVDWQDMPQVLADKLSLREELARNGIHARAPSHNSAAAAASSSTRAVGQIDAPGKTDLADATAAGIAAAKDPEVEKGLDADAGKRGGENYARDSRVQVQVRSAHGREQSERARSGAGEDDQEARQEEEADVCCVCLEESSARKPCAKMSCCSYLIHAECMEEWKEQCEVMRFPASCPACQQPCQPDVGMDLFMSKFGPLL